MSEVARFEEAMPFSRRSKPFLPFTRDVREVIDSN